MTGPRPGRLPVWDDLVADHYSTQGRHAWRDRPGYVGPIEPATQTDELGAPLTVDQRDHHAHDDHACDQAQQQPQRWTGVQRDPDRLAAWTDDA